MTRKQAINELSYSDYLFTDYNDVENYDVYESKSKFCFLYEDKIAIGSFYDYENYVFKSLNKLETLKDLI